MVCQSLLPEILFRSLVNQRIMNKKNMNGCVFGNQERATLSPKMALTIESRETGGVLEISWRNDSMINHLSEHLRRLLSHLPLGFLKDLKNVARR